MKKSIKKIVENILKVDLSNLKFMDIPVGAVSYEVRSGLKKDNEEKVYLANGHTEYLVSERQLAAAYIAESAEAFKGLTYSHELNDRPGISHLQTLLREVEDSGKPIGTIRLVCIGQVSKLNRDVKEEAPIYRRFCYTGNSKYQEEMEAIREEKHEDEYFESPAFGIRYNAIMKALHSSPVEEGRAIPKNEEKVPIFVLTLEN